MVGRRQPHTLIVDPERETRLALRAALREAGHRVVTAAGGEEALSRLRDTHFDLVVTALRLRGSLNGLRLLNMTKWRCPGTAVILLVASGSLDSALAAIREGVDGYLLKPVDPISLRAAAQRALEQGGPGRHV
jgi:DNA-binding NtrC family response regulator